ncbi:MAG: hypothetical protein P4L55_15625 [Syntrophobacteraceae bacterium]|nr:hypothetical protein [Syntrophobacteraceae bacterium]
MDMHMDRAIFDLKISVEATSLYILLCALMDAGEDPTLDNAATKWTGTRETLEQAARELIERCVVAGVVPPPPDMHLHPNRPDRWAAAACRR